MDFGGPSHRQRMMTQRDHAVQKQRDTEQQRAQLTSYVSRQGLYATAANMDDTIDIRRKKLEVEQLAREEAMETMTRTVRCAGACACTEAGRRRCGDRHAPSPPPQAQLESRRRQYERSQEAALATVLETTKREEESRRREIQRICEDDPGLRELQVRARLGELPRTTRSR